MMASPTTSETLSASSPKAAKDEVPIEKTTCDDDHTKCCAYLGTSHECKQPEGKPWREGWQEPDNHEKDDLSRKGPATSFMLGHFDEFPGYFNHPSLSEGEKLRRRRTAESTILTVLSREAERLGLEAPKSYSPAMAERVLRARIQHNRRRQRTNRRRRSLVRSVENDDFSSMLKGLGRLGLEWKPPVDMDLDEHAEG